MKSVFTETQLIIIFTLLFAVSSLFLFWQNERGLDQNLGKDWWILSFADPMNDRDLTFTVENHSLNTEFRYTVTEGKTVLATESFSLKKGATASFSPNITTLGERTTLTVTTGTQKKEIYR